MGGGGCEGKGCDCTEHRFTPSVSRSGDPIAAAFSDGKPPPLEPPNAQVGIGVRKLCRRFAEPRRCDDRLLRAPCAQLLGALLRGVADSRVGGVRAAQMKWGPALLPAPTAPSEGSAGVRNLIL